MRGLDVRYIHQRPGWPHFTWRESELLPLLPEIRHRQGRLLGRMESLGYRFQAEAGLDALTAEVVKSSSIEGTIFEPASVRSSLARRLGMAGVGAAPSSRDIEGAVEVLLDATRRYAEPLTVDRLFGWQAALLPSGRSGLRRVLVGQWRTPDMDPMQVVSGPVREPVRRKNIHFEAPEAARVPGEVDAFLRWFETPDATDAVIRAAVAHLWFVTIHPFEDGNGRVSRAIADLALARADRSDLRFYSMSAQIETERSVYYAMLERTQKGGTDITGWLVWFLGCLGRALDRGEKSVAAIIRKASTWERINAGIPVNERQRAVIHALLDGPVGDISTSRYAKLAGCSLDTALRDLKALVEAGVLAPGESGGRSTRYRLSADPAAPGAEGPRR